MSSYLKQTHSTTGTKTAFQVPENHDVSIALKIGTSSTADVEVSLQSVLDNDGNANNPNYFVPATLSALAADSIVTLEGPVRTVRLKIDAISGAADIEFLTAFRGG